MAAYGFAHLPDIIGIVGAGTMGCQIGQLVAQRGLRVLLNDASKPQLEKGMSAIKRSLDKLTLRPQNGLTPEECQAVLSRITPVDDIGALGKAEFIIEAVSEDEELKKGVFKRLSQVSAVQSIIASNTSSISITRLAAVTSKPHRVVGMHFMHPATTVPLVELAKGVHTSYNTFETAKSFAEHLGKSVCVSEDRPGFMVYRVLMPMINEAFFCMMEGVGSPEDIDRGMKLGTNMQYGPLKLADNMGLDTCLSILRVLHNGLGDPKYRPCPLLVQYVDAGWLGAKTGKGVFYYDPAHERAQLHERAPAAVAALQPPLPLHDKQLGVAVQVGAGGGEGQQALQSPSSVSSAAARGYSWDAHQQLDLCLK